MDRQLPNFNIFLNPQANVKPTQHKSTNNNNLKSNNNINNQSYRQQQFTSPSYLTTNTINNNNNSSHSLPQTQFPSTLHPLTFYKVRDRLTPHMLTSRIGYRVRQYTRVQQDYICYLTQLIMTECTWLKMFIIQPNYLYVQSNVMVMDELQYEGDSCDNIGSNINKDDQRQQVELQNNLLRLIKQISQEIINPWLDSQLKPQKLTSQQFDQQKFIQLFEKEVIQKIKQKYQSTLAVNNKRK